MDNFTEYDDMILTVLLDSVQKRVEEIKASGKPYSRWSYERGANHVHANMSALDREHVRQELEIAADFEAALRRTYPDRSFVIAHIPCYAVTFYQATEDAPTEDVLSDTPLEEKAWCQRCECKRPYRLLPVPDAEFPKAEWGKCETCGDDIIVRAGEILTLIEASQ